MNLRYPTTQQALPKIFIASSYLKSSLLLEFFCFLCNSHSWNYTAET